EGVVQRKQVHQGAQQDAPCAARRRGEEHVLRRRHAQRRLMVLGEMIGVIAKLVGTRQKLQALVVRLVERNISQPLEMIENAKLQAHGTLSQGSMLTKNACSSGKLPAAVSI